MLKFQREIPLLNHHRLKNKRELGKQIKNTFKNNYFTKNVSIEQYGNLNKHKAISSQKVWSVKMALMTNLEIYWIVFDL